MFCARLFFFYPRVVVTAFLPAVYSPFLSFFVSAMFYILCTHPVLIRRYIFYCAGFMAVVFICFFHSVTCKVTGILWRGFLFQFHTYYTYYTYYTIHTILHNQDEGLPQRIEG